MNANARKLMREKPDLLCFIVAGVTIFAAILNFFSARQANDYIEIEAEICNVESEAHLRHGSYVTRYDYDIVWYIDGEEHVEHMENQMEQQEEGTCTLWVDPEGDDFRLSSAEDIASSVPRYVVTSLVTFVLGIIIYKVRTRNN